MLGISMRRMRVQHPGGHDELRDGLDIAWWTFLAACFPAMPYIPLPNSPRAVGLLLNSAVFSGFILTGGDDPGVYPERDEAETMLLEFAKNRRLPVIGVCRGAQLINSVSGGTLKKADGHAGTRHKIYYNSSGPREINSFHKFAIDRLGENLEASAVDENGTVEAFHSADNLLKGVMWHPEREVVPDMQDVNLFVTMFKRKP